MRNPVMMTPQLERCTGYPGAAQFMAAQPAIRQGQVPTALMPVDATAHRGTVEITRFAADVTLGESRTEVTFEVDADLERVIVKVVDKETRAVVRQFPMRPKLAIASSLAADYSLGLLINTAA